MINQTQLKFIMPKIKDAEKKVDILNKAMSEFGISSKQDVAAFLATTALESSQLNTYSEDLNYRAERLLVVFSKYFSSITVANIYAHDPQKIANKVYASRGGNGDEKSGDGWTYRGAGAIQLTFKNNQKQCAEYFGMYVEKVGNWLRTDEGAIRSAAWFWKTRGIQKYSVVGDLDGVRDLVNIGHKTAKIGDAIGYEEFKAFYQKAISVL